MATVAEQLAAAGILDELNHPEAELSNGGKWAAWWSDTGQDTVNGWTQRAGHQYATALWTAATFAVPCYIGATFKEVPAAGRGLGFVVARTGTTFLEAFIRYESAGKVKVEFLESVEGVETELAAVTGVTIAKGDRFYFTAQDGTNGLRVWRQVEAKGTVSQVAATTPPSLAGFGKEVALVLAGEGTVSSNRITNFSAGVLELTFLTASAPLEMGGTGLLLARRLLAASGALELGGSGTLEVEHPEVNRIRVVERPPMRQYALATTPGGRTERWATDEPEAANVLEDFTDSDSAPGGCKDFTGALPRKPGVSYADMKLGTKLEVFGAGGYKVSEYRLERTPRTSGDYLVMDPAASGYQVLLSDDEGARGIFLDSDMTGWGEPTARRRAAEAVKAFKFNMNASATVLPAGTPNAAGESQPAAVSHAWAQMASTVAAPDIAESWYDSGGIELGAVLLEFLTAKGIGASELWNDAVYASDDDIATAAELLKDFNGVSATGRQEFAIAASRFFLILQDYFKEFTGTAESGWEAQWRNIKVRDRSASSIPLYGTWPEVGVLASDVIAYLLSQFAPGIHFTTGPYGTLKPSSFVIPHLAFKDPTTLLDMITQALRFELLEWGVWPGQFGPTFYLNPWGQREGRKRWRARVRQAKLTETGQQMDQVWNKVVMSWTDVDGTTKTIGPPGSGYVLTDARCEDSDPLNPINEAGGSRTKHLTMNGPATANGAAETAARFLEQAKLLDVSGEATLTGYVEDEHGAEWPYYCVRSTDEIEFIDSSISGYRYIVEANRSRKGRGVNIKIDSPPDSYANLLERLQVREAVAGIS